MGNSIEDLTAENERLKNENDLNLRIIRNYKETNKALREENQALGGDSNARLLEEKVKTRQLKRRVEELETELANESWANDKSREEVQRLNEQIMRGHLISPEEVSWVPDDFEWGPKGVAYVSGELDQYVAKLQLRARECDQAELQVSRLTAQLKVATQRLDMAKQDTYSMEQAYKVALATANKRADTLANDIEEALSKHDEENF